MFENQKYIELKIKAQAYHQHQTIELIKLL